MQLGHKWVTILTIYFSQSNNIKDFNPIAQRIWRLASLSELTPIILKNNN